MLNIANTREVIGFDVRFDNLTKKDLEFIPRKIVEHIKFDEDICCYVCSLKISEVRKLLEEANIKYCDYSS